MAINKKFPNYQRPVMKVTVIRHEAGINRTERRSRILREKRSKSWNLSLEKRMLEKQRADRTAAWVRARVLRAQTRRVEREAAVKAGVPVEYSMA